MLKIDDLKIYSDLTEREILLKAIKKYNIKEKDIIDFNITKKSIDARNKNNIHYNYSLVIEVQDDHKYPNIKSIIKEKIPWKMKPKKRANRVAITIAI